MTSTRRSFTKCASLCLGALAGTRFASGQVKGGVVGSEPIAGRVRGPAKSKRDLVMQVMENPSKPGYIHAGFFMHFGVRGDAALKAHLDYFHATGMDFVKIQYDEQTFPAHKEIQSPKDWAKLPVLPESWFEPTLYLLKGLVREAKKEALIIQTMYSPYQHAKQAVSGNLFEQHVKQDAESVCRGMENITLSLIHFVNAAARAGVDGFYMCSQGGDTKHIADQALFCKAIKNYDMMLHKEISSLVPANILHVCDYDGSYGEGFQSRFQDYPGKVVNVPNSAEGKPLTMRQAAEMFKRPVMGGIDRLGIISTGSAEDARKAAMAVLKDAPGNFILGADCTVSNKTPIANLKAAIQAAHQFRA